MLLQSINSAFGLPALVHYLASIVNAQKYLQILRLSGAVWLAKQSYNHINQFLAKCQRIRHKAGEEKRREEKAGEGNKLGTWAQKVGAYQKSMRHSTVDPQSRVQSSWSGEEWSGARGEKGYTVRPKMVNVARGGSAQPRTFSLRRIFSQFKV